MLEPISTTLFVAFIILIVGFFASKVIEKIILFFYRRKYPSKLGKPTFAKITGYVINIITLVLALSVLKIRIEIDTLLELYDFAPTILSVVLLFILVILLVQFIFFTVTKFLRRSGIRKLMKDYEKEYLLDTFLDLLKIILYVIFVLIALKILGINISAVTSFLTFILYPILIFILLLLFIALKDFIKNMAVGFYFKYSQFFKAGEYVKFNGDELKVHDIQNQGLVMKAKDGYRLFKPYKEFFDKGFYYKKVENKLDTLEKIKEHYIAQNASYCGPASVSMILKIFGYEVSQKRIGKLAGTIVPKDGEFGGTRPWDLIKVVDKVTKGKVIGGWIDIDHISNLKDELKGWLDEGALPVVDYKKSFLFPSAKKAHYSICLEVNGDELLLVDPSSRTGGVYYADYKRVYQGMDTFSELLKAKRGYFVLARDGTGAYQRIKDGLIYSDPDFYNSLNNKFIRQLKRIKGKTANLDVILPKEVKDFLTEFKEKDKISRIWKP
jgi:hypothetical protein